MSRVDDRPEISGYNVRRSTLRGATLLLAAPFLASCGALGSNSLDGRRRDIERIGTFAVTKSHKIRDIREITQPSPLEIAAKVDFRSIDPTEPLPSIVGKVTSIYTHGSQELALFQLVLECSNAPEVRRLLVRDPNMNRNVIPRDRMTEVIRTILEIPTDAKLRPPSAAFKDEADTTLIEGEYKNMVRVIGSFNRLTQQFGLAYSNLAALAK